MEEQLISSAPESGAEEKNKFLGEANLNRLLWKFSLPCVLSLLVSSLYNIVDQIFIGNSELGYLGNAATGVVFPVLVVSQAFAWCFGDGSAAYLSICQGKKNTRDIPKCVGTGVTVTLLSALLLLFACALFREPLLWLCGASPQTIGMAKEYLTILLGFLPLYMLSNMMNSIIRADGSPAYSMAATASGALVNIVLDPIFIFVLHWGIAGAAWATVLGQTVSFFFAAAYYFRAKTFKLRVRDLIPDFKAFGEAVKLGICTFITQMSIVVVSLVCNILFSRYGALSKYGPDIPISVISIETKVFTIVIDLVVGVALGCQPVFGYNYGAKKYRRVKEAYRKVMLVTIFVGIAATLIFELCPQVVVRIFGSHEGLYEEFAELTFRVFLALILVTCVIKMNSIFFQTVGQPVKAAVASLTRDLACFVPLAFLLANEFGIRGILYAAPIADLLAGILTVGLTAAFFKKINRAERAEERRIRQLKEPLES